MRICLMVAGLLLAGCGAPQGASVEGETDGASVKTAGLVEAEHACAEMTGHVAADRAGAPSAADEKRRHEFQSCVSTVLKGEDTPALRGRTAG